MQAVKNEVVYDDSFLKKFSKLRQDHRGASLSSSLTGEALSHSSCSDYACLHAHDRRQRRLQEQRSLHACPTCCSL